MLEVTVKTLDSVSRPFTVEEEMTVREFKETIAESVNIPADKQRLIFQGRVLKDHTKLKEYNVHGNVIHLVERAPPPRQPPTSSSSAGSSTSTSASSSNGQSAGVTQGGDRNGNNFVIGAFTLPADVVDPNQIQNVVQSVLSGMGDLGRNARVTSRASPDGSSVDVHINLGQIAMPQLQSESQLRIDQAQRMIQEAHDCLNRLENPPGRQRSNSLPSSLGEQPSQGEGAGVTSRDAESIPTTTASAEEPMDTQSATPGETGAQTQVAGGSAADPTPGTAVAAGATGPSNTSQPGATGATGPSSTSQPGATGANTQTSTPTSTSNPQGTTRPGVQHPAPAVLADVFDEIQAFNERLRPHMERYHQILRNEVDYSGQFEEYRENQRLVNIISQILHNLSHAYHSLSDIMLDLSRTPPRYLRAPPAPQIQMMGPVQTASQIRIPILQQFQNQATFTTSAPGMGTAASRTSTGTSAVPQTSSATSQTPPAPQAQVSSATTQTAHAPDTTAAPPSSQDAAAAAANNDLASAHTQTDGTPSASAQTQTQTTEQRTTTTTTQTNQGQPGATFRQVIGGGGTPSDPLVMLEMGPQGFYINRITATIHPPGQGPQQASTGVSTGTSTTSSTASSTAQGAPPASSAPGPSVTVTRHFTTTTNPAGARFSTGTIPMAPPQLMQQIIQQVSQHAASATATAAAAAATAAATAAANMAGQGQQSGQQSGQQPPQQPAGNGRTNTAGPGRPSTQPPGNMGRSLPRFTTGQPGRGPMAVPGTVALNPTDPFLPCSSRHFLVVRQNQNQQPRAPPPPQPQPQGGVGGDGQLGDMIQGVLQGLMQQQNPYLHPQGAPGAASGPRGPQPLNPQTIVNMFNSILQPPGSSEGSTTPSAPPPAAPPPATTQAAQNFSAMFQDVVQDGIREAGSQSTMSSSSTNTTTTTTAGSPTTEPSPGTQPTNQSDQPPAPPPRVGVTDETFHSLIGGIGGFMQQAAVGQPSAETIADFLTRISPEYNIQEEEGFLAEVFQLLTSSFTFLDLMRLFFGQSAPLANVRPQLEQFVTRQLQEQPPTQANIQAAVGRILDSMQCYITDAINDAQVQGRDNIDLVRTHTEFCRHHMYRVMNIIANSTDDDAGFAQRLFEACRLAVQEWLRLTTSCITDGLRGVERIVNSRMRVLAGEVNPAILTWMQTMSTGHLRNLMQTVTVPESQIQHYYVRREPQPVQVEQAAPVSTPAAPGTAAEEVTPAPDSRAQEVTRAEEVTSCHGQKRDRANAEETQPQENAGRSEEAGSLNGVPEPEAMDEDEEPAGAPGLPWQSVVPADWVPVIQRDIETQRNLQPQPPFSDAYSTGIPAKRRKTSHAGREIGSMSSVVPEALKQAVLSSGVQPTTSMEEFTEEAENSATLHAAYEQQVRSSVRHRLRNDPNYTAERFPSTHKYFEEDNP
ncbi:BAG6 [Branchiostoma lanceolatum]|uniref:Large proline-rich protein BAG6 n=1 Tax=Branchiostoma lanceolatum TaxID=7740 RepID=A0A8K0ABB2_BRALA|nr:BAG6 [Branchiostoma lanceolatum]